MDLDLAGGKLRKFAKQRTQNKERMTKEEMAQQFAEQKTEEVKEMQKAAFLKGYDQGALQTACSISIEGVKYYDLGLPSGTLWSEPLSPAFSGGYIKMPYLEACKYDGLPTEEQWEELKTMCKVQDNKIIGITGQRLRIYFSGCWQGEAISEKGNKFWLKSEMDSNHCNKSGRFYETSFENCCFGTGSHFAGYKLPIMLTKKKEDIIEG